MAKSADCNRPVKFLRSFAPRRKYGLLIERPAVASVAGEQVSVVLRILQVNRKRFAEGPAGEQTAFC